MKTTSDVHIGDVLYKLFDSCELDNSWESTQKPSDNFYSYEALVDNSEVELSRSGLKEKESYSFKKGSIIQISSNFLGYREQDLIK